MKDYFIFTLDVRRLKGEVVGPENTFHGIEAILTIQ